MPRFPFFTIMMRLFALVYGEAVLSWFKCHDSVLQLGTQATVERCLLVLPTQAVLGSGTRYLFWVPSIQRSGKRIHQQGSQNIQSVVRTGKRLYRNLTRSASRRTTLDINLNRVV